MDNTPKKRLPPMAKLALDLGPLAIFFLTLLKAGIFAATAAFMVAVVVALAIGFIKEHRVSPMPLISAAVVLVFGGLTLYLRNDIFIKIKPTIVYIIFAAILAGGLATGRTFIKTLFDHAIHLNDEGWRKLTYRWIGFFIAMACINEIVWRNFSQEIWAGFKLLGAIPLTLLFAIAQTPLMLRYQIDSDKSGAGE